MSESSSHDKQMRNPGCDFDVAYLRKVQINSTSVHESVECVQGEKIKLSENCKATLLLRAVSCLDLTTLNGDDTYGNVFRLCQWAVEPVRQSLLNYFDFEGENFTAAAVCVYPARVADAVKSFALLCTPAERVVPIASVAGGFPSGQYGIKSKLLEIEYALENGADEIDVVINREFVLTGKWDALYDELKQMRAACGRALMKTILSTGELSNFENIYKASYVAMMAGTDFIKTSTGKEVVNARLPAGYVMMRAIRDYYDNTNYKVGFKPSGGIKTSDDALNWLILVKRELGSEWLTKDYFRIGASSLLEDIVKDLDLMASKKI